MSRSIRPRVSFEIVNRSQCLWYWYDLNATVDGVTERIGRDGGEPEDQNLHRDWDWVKPALERFYALGVEHGRAFVSEARPAAAEPTRNALEDYEIAARVRACAPSQEPDDPHDYVGAAYSDGWNDCLRALREVRS